MRKETILFGINNKGDSEVIYNDHAYMPSANDKSMWSDNIVNIKEIEKQSFNFSVRKNKNNSFNISDILVFKKPALGFEFYLTIEEYDKLTNKVEDIDSYIIENTDGKFRYYHNTSISSLNPKTIKKFIPTIDKNGERKNFFLKLELKTIDKKDFYTSVCGIKIPEETIMKLKYDLS
jgi:hypothetical protein